MWADSWLRSRSPATAAPASEAGAAASGGWLTGKLTPQRTVSKLTAARVQQLQANAASVTALQAAPNK